MSPLGDEVSQEGSDDRLVLSVARPEPDRHLGAVGRDDQGDYDPSSSSPTGSGQVGVAPGGRSGQHALDDEGVKQIHRAERLPGVELYLGPECYGPSSARS